MHHLLPSRVTLGSIQIAQGSTTKETKHRIFCALCHARGFLSDFLWRIQKQVAKKERANLLLYVCETCAHRDRVLTVAKILLDGKWHGKNVEGVHVFELPEKRRAA